MTSHWDEFSKSLAEESLPRRESLRRLGAVLAGAVLSPLGLETAFAGSGDPCKSFCRCRNKKQQNQCLAACNACNKDTNRLAGSCGNYFCCGSGQASCGSYCADLAFDVFNCGGCGHVCDQPGPYEYGACVYGDCLYECVEGAVYCNGTCTFLDGDPDNCGACGNICGASAPYCNQGVCIVNPCGPGVDLLFDALNCGACGFQCPQLEYCSWGVCVGSCIGCE